MEIKPPSLSPSQLARLNNSTATAIAATVKGVPADWQIGRLIEALVIKITGNQLFLNIQGTQVHTAKPPNLAVQPGQTLVLSIEARAPVPQFRVLNQKTSALLQQVQPGPTLQAPVKTTADLFNNISFVSNRPALRPYALPPPVIQEIRQLFQQLPAPFNLKTGAQVKSFIQNSGLFLENKLATLALNSTSNKNMQPVSSAEKILSQDLRTSLLRLADTIRAQLLIEHPVKADSSTLNSGALNLKAPPVPVPENSATTPNMSTKPQPQTARETTVSMQTSLANIDQQDEAMQTLLKQVESSLTRMQQNQLQSQTSEGQAGRAIWFTELPVKNGQDVDLYKLRIEQEQSSAGMEDNEANKRWNVTLEFDLEKLGPVKAHVRLYNEEISALFSSPSESTLKLFRQHFNHLEGRLRYNGLSVSELNCDIVQNMASGENINDK